MRIFWLFLIVNENFQKSFSDCYDFILIFRVLFREIKKGNLYFWLTKFLRATKARSVYIYKKMTPPRKKSWLLPLICGRVGEWHLTWWLKEALTCPYLNMTPRNASKLGKFLTIVQDWQITLKRTQKVITVLIHL